MLQVHLAPRRFLFSLVSLLCLTLAGLGQSALPAAAEQPSAIFILPIQYRSQFDGTPYQSGNCGPASLGMIASAFRDEHVKTTDIRELANIMQGTTGTYDSGTSFEVLTAIGRRFGLIPLNLYNSGSGYHQWTLDEVREHLRAGYPVVPQVQFRRMPGHEAADATIDHFVVLIGTSGDNFIYHDPAFYEYSGQSLVITPEQLLYAWKTGDFGFAAVAFQPESSLPSLLVTQTPTPQPPPTITPTMVVIAAPTAPTPTPQVVLRYAPSTGAEQGDALHTDTTNTASSRGGAKPAGALESTEASTSKPSPPLILLLLFMLIPLGHMLCIKRAPL
jgi:hypothetical protein